MQGIYYLHAQKVLHRDLSPRNILMGKDHQVKVADFGLARLMETECQGVNYSRFNSDLHYFQAPELVRVLKLCY